MKENYTYVSSNTTTNGTIGNLQNMQSNNSAYATMTEGANTVYASYGWGFNTTIESWTPTWTGSGGTVTNTSAWVNDGNPAGGTYSRITTTSSTARTRTSNWTSPAFTWNGGTPSSASLYFDWKVQTYTLASGSSGGPHTIEVRWDNPNITLGTNTYSLNITTSTTNVYEDLNSNYYLEINYSRDAGETGYDVYVSNGTDWIFKGSLTSSLWSPANFTLNSSEIIRGNVDVLYLDQTPAGATQGNMYIDYQRVHNVTPAIPPGSHLDIIANNTGIADASAHKLELSLNYLLSDGAFSPGTVNDLPRYYVLVRYIDESTSKQGKLYLDYQRMNSS